MKRTWLLTVVLGVLKAALLFGFLAVAGSFALFRSSPTALFPSDPDTESWRAGGLTFELRSTTLRARENEASGVGTRWNPVPVEEYALFEDQGRKIAVAVTGVMRPDYTGAIPLVDRLRQNPSAPSDIEYVCDGIDTDEWISMFFAFDHPPIAGLPHFDRAWLSSGLVLDGREFPQTRSGSTLCLDGGGGRVYRVSSDVEIGRSAMVRVTNPRTGREVWFLVDMRGIG